MFGIRNRYFCFAFEPFCEKGCQPIEFSWMSMTWRKFKNAETRQIIKICSSHIIYCSVWQSRIKYIKQSGVEYIWLDCKFGSVSSSDQTEADHLKEPTRTETNEQNAKWMCDVLRRAANDTIQICNLIHLFFYVPNIP